MNSDRLEQIDHIFQAALDLPSERRADFLILQCGSDSDLLAEVQSLLSAHESAGEFIEDSASELAAAVLVSQPVQAMRLGPYKIEKLLGSGGMGTVYLAARADEQYQKRVAIKLIKRGMDTDYVVRRFRNERQILAGFDHPNIARLLDGDTTEDGLPYFVMEYVEGVPIDEYCDQHELSITERLELFLQVCAAVSYAHQHLVIHRDIKPSNILVTDEGAPKLLDFGIAKILQPSGGDETNATTTGLLLMTPEYASAEQLQGQPVTTVTDVYSLGVVLYELLTGRWPYRSQSRSPHDVARAVTGTEPLLPSAVIDAFREDVDAKVRNEKSSLAISKLREGSLDRLRRRLRGDLDNIVLMAIRKDPARRYQSVEQLSEDIRRHLDGLPVLARKDTLRYRATTFVRRNRLAAGAGALVLLTLVAGVIGTTWQAHQARVNEQIAIAEKIRAERRFNDVRKLAHAVLFDYHDAVKNLPGATPVREMLVRDALTYLDSLTAEAGDDPALQRELAAAYDRVGDVRGQAYSSNLGDSAGALESYLKALRIREDLVKANPRDVQNQRDLADIHRKIGNRLLDTSEAARGLEHLQQALALYLPLAAEQPAITEIRSELAGTYNDLGLAFEDRGDAVAATENHRKALAVREELVAVNPSNDKNRRDLSVTYVNMGRALFLNGDVHGALEINRKALALRTALVDHDATNSDYRRLLAISYQNDGDFRDELGDTNGALESFRRKIALDTASLAADPANAQSRSDFAYSSQRLGNLLMTQNDHSHALSYFQQSLAAYETLAAADRQNLYLRTSIVMVLSAIARINAKMGNRLAAQDATNRTVAVLTEMPDDPTNAALSSVKAAAFSYLGDAHAALGSSRKTAGSRDHWSAARAMYQRSLDIWQDMRNRGVLNRKDDLRLESIVRRELATCNAALRK